MKERLLFLRKYAKRLIARFLFLSFNIKKGGLSIPRFRQTSDILRIMGNKEGIRNTGIIAHIDHGKRN